MSAKSPDENKAKRWFVNRIAARIWGQNQYRAATRIGLTQPNVSQIMAGKTAGFSLWRLMVAMTRLGFDIDIVVKSPEDRDDPKRRRGKMVIRFWETL